MDIASQIGLVVFFAVIAFGVTAVLARVARRMRVRDHLRKRIGGDDRGMSLLKAQEHEVSDLARLLTESGLGWSMSVFVTRMVLATVVGIAVGFAIGGLALALLLGAIGVAVFPVLARQAREKRLHLCDQQMPQALEIVTLALRAGHPLPKALAIAAAEAPLPIADELQRAVDENDLGRPVGDVLLNMSQRLPESESVSTFVTAVLVLQQTGGNLISVIDRIVENARARAQYRAKLRALTAEGRASAKMLALMPPAFAVLAASVDPDYAATLFYSTSGNIVLAVTVGLWLLGMLWTRRLVKAE
jgi:tight adherence protein B